VRANFVEVQSGTNAQNPLGAELIQNCKGHATRSFTCPHAGQLAQKELFVGQTAWAARLSLIPLEDNFGTA
jgi:hypothetical protein